MFDWRIGGAIVGRIAAWFSSSSVLLRLVSPEGCIAPGLAAAARWLACSSSSPLLGGFAGLGTGGLIARPRTDPNREVGRLGPAVSR